MTDTRGRSTCWVIFDGRGQVDPHPLHVTTAVAHVTQEILLPRLTHHQSISSHCSLQTLISLQLSTQWKGGHRSFDDGSARAGEDPKRVDVRIGFGSIPNR